MIILPTKGRPKNLQRFIEAHSKLASAPVYVVFDKEDATSYECVKFPSNFKRVCVPSWMRLGDIFNRLFQTFPNEEYYGIVADDVVPGKEEYDSLLAEAAIPNRIAWGFDGGADETLPRHPFIGGELIRWLGYIAPPGMKHWYIDDVWRELGKAFNCAVYLPEIPMLHFHPANGTAPEDRTYLDQPNTTVDRMTFERWKRFILPELVKRYNGI